MRKVLKLKFKNAEGKTKVLSISKPKTDLTADVVKTAMENISAAKAFEKDSVDMYTTPVKAYYYTTQEDNIVSLEAEDKAA